MRFLTALLLILLMAPPALAEGVITPAQQVALDRAAARGRLLFVLDQAAWVSTETLMAQRDKLKGYWPKLGGWIVEQVGRRFIVTYFERFEDKPPRAFYVATVEDRKVVGDRFYVGADRFKLTPVQLQMMSALAAIAGQQLAPCTKGAFNTVVVPPSGKGEPVEVYLLSPLGPDGEIPLGGHHLFLVDASGKLLSSRPFTNSCVNIPRNRETVAITVSHLLDSTPTEIHVFTALETGMPVFVLTTQGQDRLWKVKGDSISVVKDFPPDEDK